MTIFIISVAVFAVLFFLLKMAKKTQQPIRLLGDGSYEYDIVGEASYQVALRGIAGSGEDGAEFSCEAKLIPEPFNKYDRHAIRVDIDGCRVGYIPRAETGEFHSLLRGRTAIVDAMIVGGWRRGKKPGMFGVKLDVLRPLRCD